MKTSGSPERLSPVRKKDSTGTGSSKLAKHKLICFFDVRRFDPETSYHSPTHKVRIRSTTAPVRSTPALQ